MDPAAILHFDPFGGAGPALTPSNVRAYLSGAIFRATTDEFAAGRARVTAAEEARRQVLADDSLYAPLWKEEAFALQDGRIRPMTQAEKAVFDEVEAAEEAQQSMSARNTLSILAPGQRMALADAVERMLEVGVHMAARDVDGYEKVDRDWFWTDYEDGRVVARIPADPIIESALLRYELVHASITQAMMQQQLTALLQRNRPGVALPR
jgi:hypothetical protein